MSSCRMAATPDEGPVSATGQVWGVHRLYVADGSVLPTSLGINPMVTIEAMAHMIAGHIISDLKQSSVETGLSE